MSPRLNVPDPLIARLRSVGWRRGLTALALLASASAVAGVSRASAQDVVVLIVERATSDAERDAIHAALREELGLEVRRAASASDGELALRVSIRGRRARLVVTRPGRARSVRSVRLPRHPEARLHTLVTLAVNLTRDEAADLLSALRRPAPDSIAAETTEAPPPPDPAVNAAAVGDPATAGGAGRAGDDAASDAAVQGAALQDAALQDAAVQDAAVEDAAVEDTDPSGPVAASDAQPDGHAPAPDPWRHRILRLGAGAHLGTAPEVGGGLVPWTLFGADVVIAPIPELAIGVREVGGFGGQGPVFTANPVVEAAWRVHHRIALHAIVGCDLQLKLSTLGGESFSVAPRLGVGARVYADPIFSVALDLTGRVVVTDAFHTMSTALPSGAVLLTIGLSFAFHI